jgi:glycosyltransferase family protein
MFVLGERETVERIRDGRLSISRYGDGEFKICVGGSAKSQKANPKMADKLRRILHSNLEYHMVGVPRIYLPRKDWPTKEKAKFWEPFAVSPRYYRLLDITKEYGSSFITRPDSSGQIDAEYYEMVKSIWSDKEVLVVMGYSCGFCKDESLVSNAANYKILFAHDRDAYDDYSNLLCKIVDESDSYTIIILALGPTATVLAYDLTINGRQALDLGHLGMFYAKVHPKQLNGEVPL